MQFNMKAVSCHAPGKLRLGDYPAPGPPREGWALVGVSHVGVCRADFRLFEGGVPRLAYPRVPGHELSGRVLMVGEGVALPIGREVVVNPYLACGKCLGCQTDGSPACEAVEVLGVHRDGGLCERIVVPAANLYPTSGLALAEAASVECLAVGAHAVRRSLVGAGKRSFLLVGAGPIGLGTALVARIAGLNVMIADRDPDRLDFAGGHLGLAIADAGDLAAESARSGSTDEGFDVVFDATGDNSCIRTASNLVALRGTLVMLSAFRKGSSISAEDIHRRRMKLVLSEYPQRCDFEHVVECARNGAISISKLITHRASLAGAPNCMARWTQQKSQVIKAVISVGSH